MALRRIYVAGHRGMVGSAILRRLELREDVQVICASRKQLDLLDQSAVFEFMLEGGFDEVYVAAARVGGIHANDTYPADFIYQNLEIQNNLIYGAFRGGVQRLLFLGSSCIYPRDAEQPMKEDALLTGQLEPTNEPYAIAKIAGIKLCESLNRQYGVDYRSVMPTNLYGVNDNFHHQNSHVIPALMRRFHEAVVAEADEVVVWGSGNVSREFLSVDDMAAACEFVMALEQPVLAAHISTRCSHLNVGTGCDVTISALAKLMAKVTGFEGDITYDTSKPDGAPRKLLDVTLLKGLGWRSTIPLEKGLEETYRWFVRQLEEGDNARLGD